MAFSVERLEEARILGWCGICTGILAKYVMHTKDDYDSSSPFSHNASFMSTKRKEELI